MRIFAPEAMRSANIDKHGIDPAEFEIAFSFDCYLTIPIRPSHTGRKRIKLIGTWHESFVVVAIVSPLGTEAMDVVSVRRANAKGIARYDEA